MGMPFIIMKILPKNTDIIIIMKEKYFYRRRPERNGWLLSLSENAINLLEYGFVGGLEKVKLNIRGHTKHDI
jgi:hypothetical protein